MSWIQNVPASTPTPPTPPGGNAGDIQFNAGGGNFGGEALVPLAHGGTNADLSGTGGAHFVLRQSTVGGSITVAQLAYSDLSGTPQLAQTKAAITSNWLNSYTASTGLFTATQPAFSDISGSIAIGQTPLTTLGDTLYVDSTPALHRLAGNITTTKMYLSQTGNGAISAAPVWAQINYADIAGTTPTPPSGTVLWSTLGNAAADLTLANAGFNTTFNQTSAVNWKWANTTASAATPVTYSDSFAGSSLSGNWAKISTSDFSISAGNCTASVNFNNAIGALAYWNANTFGADQSAECIIGSFNVDAGPAIRVSPTGSCYLLAVTSAHIILYKLSAAGVFSPLGSTYLGPHSIGDTVKIGASGTAITATLNGAPICGTPVTDSTYSSGQPGMYGYAPGTGMKSWSATDNSAIVAQSSPIFNLSGTYWTGSASAADGWTVQDIIAASINGSSTLTFTHSGTSGVAAVQVPILNAVTDIMSPLHLFSSAADAGISRLGAGSLAIGNGTAGDFTGSLKLTGLSVQGALTDGSASVGTAGQVLSSTGTKVAWVNAGSAGVVATSDLTAQSASITATTIYAVPAAGAGLYRVSWVATITTVDSTGFTLGGTTGFQTKYTNKSDSVVKTSNPTTPTVSAINATGTSISGVIYANCKASTNLQYLFAITTLTGDGRYDLSIRVEALL